MDEDDGGRTGWMMVGGGLPGCVGAGTGRADPAAHSGRFEGCSDMMGSAVLGRFSPYGGVAVGQTGAVHETIA